MIGQRSKAAAFSLGDAVAADQPTGVIFDIKRYALHDGPGIRTTFFLKGCPLTCAWCANVEGIHSEKEVWLVPGHCIRCGTCVESCPESAAVLTDNAPMIDRSRCTRCAECVETCPTNTRAALGQPMSVAEVIKQLERDRLFFDESEGGVTFSGGEPLMQHAFLLACLQACHKRDIHTAVDTSGAAATEAILAIAEYADLFLYDLKLMDDERHRALVGVSNQLIHENLRQLVVGGKRVWVRVPLIPGINDDDENLDRLADFVLSLSPHPPVFLLPYHRIGSDKYDRLGRTYTLPNIEPPSKAHVETIAKRLSDQQLDVKIGG